MTPQRNVEILQAAHEHLKEIGMNGVRRAIAAIDAALSTNSRKPLKAHDFIPPDLAEMDRARGEFARVVSGSMAEAKSRMPTEVTRRFLDAPPVVEAFAQAMSGMLGGTPEAQKMQALRESLITDVHSGKGPLRAETVEALQELRALYLDLGRKANTATIPPLPTDEPEGLVLATAMTFPVAVMSKRIADHNAKKHGDTVMLTPPVTDADLEAYAQVFSAYDELFEVANEHFFPPSDEDRPGM